MRLLVFSYCRIGKIRLELKVHSPTSSLNWMLPRRDKQVAETVSDVEDKFLGRNEIGRKRKITQKSRGQISGYM